jgi:hypothetical protein
LAVTKIKKIWRKRMNDGLNRKDVAIFVDSMALGAVMFARAGKNNDALGATLSGAGMLASTGKFIGKASGTLTPNKHGFFTGVEAVTTVVSLIRPSNNRRY